MEGFVTAVKTERNIKVMLVAGVCTVIAGCIVGLDIAEWATIIICCGLVIHGELCNTAMEAIVDLATRSSIRWQNAPRTSPPPLYTFFPSPPRLWACWYLPRARLYLERDSHVRQYAVYR